MVKVGVLEALSDYGVDVAAKDTSGKSILHYGAIHGSLSKEILSFIQKNNLLQLDDRDAQKKNPPFCMHQKQPARSDHATHLPDIDGSILWSVYRASPKLS